MTKREVLEIFVSSGRSLTSDMVCRQLSGFHFRSSVYSYLFRLHKQGLLLRQTLYGRVAYQISERGIERLRYLRSTSRNQNLAGKDAVILSGD